MVVTPDSIEMTRGEICERIDTGARKRRGVSGDELLRQYRDGELVNPGDVADLLALADLIDPDYDGQ
jgi:hypothetical protein